MAGIEPDIPNSVEELAQRYLAEIPSWGHLPAAMRFKQQLVTRLEPRDAFLVVRSHVRVPGLDRLVRRPMRRLVDAVRETPDFRLLWQGGDSFVHPAPHIIGATNHGPMRGRTRSAWLARLDNVTLRGRSALLQVDDVVLVDQEVGEGEQIRDNPEYDPGVLATDAGDFWMMESESPQTHLDEAFLLSGSHTVDFGHWMVEYLPRLSMALLAGWQGGMPVLIDEQTPKTIRDALPQLLPPGCQLVVIPPFATVTVSRLWCTPNPGYMGYYPTEWNLGTWDDMAIEANRLATLIRKVVDQSGPETQQPTGIERVYLARQPGRKKKLTNHTEIESLVREFGFKKVYPEEMGFLEQIRLARNARFLVMPEGSNAFLAMYARPGTRVCLLSPPYTHPLVDVNATLTSLGIRMTIVTGTEFPADEFCPFWHDYHIDPESFQAFLTGWLRD
jgi:capsular polysaccharide biosynthesis protein